MVEINELTYVIRRECGCARLIARAITGCTPRYVTQARSQFELVDVYDEREARTIDPRCDEHRAQWSQGA